jgi:hypothetical protein
MDDILVKCIRSEGEEEEWIRVTEEENILGVCATRTGDGDWPWQVSIYVAEFVRAEPLRSQLVDTITAALASIRGVTRAAQEDREVWAIQGNVGGEALIQACSVALNQLAPLLRQAYAAL